MGARRNEAGVTLNVAAGQVVPANREQACEFALASRVRLEADGVIAGQFGEPLFQLRDEEEVPPDVRSRREGVDPAKLAPRDGFHLGCRIELHRARPKRNHSAVEREVLVRETFEETHHRRFAAVRVEHGVGENVVRTTECARDGRIRNHGNRGRCRFGCEPKNRVDQHVIAARQNARCEAGREFIETDLNRVGVRDVKQQARGVGGGCECLRLARDPNLNGVKEIGVDHVVTSGLCAASETVRFFRDIDRDLTESGRAVIDGVHCGEDSEEHLCRANIRSRLVATNVLFTGLESQAIGGSTVSVTRDADQASGHLPFESRGHGEECRVRSPEAKRNAKTLRRTDNDFGTLRTGRGEKIQREQVARNDGHAANTLDCRDVHRNVANATRRPGVLNKCSEGTVGNR